MKEVYKLKFELSQENSVIMLFSSNGINSSYQFSRKCSLLEIFFTNLVEFLSGTFCVNFS